MKLFHFVLLGLVLLISACTAAEQVTPTMAVAASTPERPLSTVTVFPTAILSRQTTPTATATIPPSTTPFPTRTSTPSPTPSFTPSPTWASPTPTLPLWYDSLTIAFSDETHLWLWQNGSIQPVVKADEYTQLKISDDGSMIAFRYQNGLWVVNSDGTNKRQLISPEDFNSLEPLDPGVGLSQFDWVPGTHTLFFNTVIRGFGLYYSDDLYQVDTDTMEWEMLRSPGEGGKFVFSPDGQKVALITPFSIHVVNVNNRAYRPIFDYKVQTNSETYYYASPTWEPDSQSLIVDIPPEDYYLSSPSTRWRLYVDGTPAELITILPPSDYPGSKNWSPKMQHFEVYSHKDNRHYRGTSEKDLEPITEPTPHSWEFTWIDDWHFLYVGYDGLMLGTIGAPSIKLVDENEFGDYIHFYDFTN